MHKSIPSLICRVCGSAEETMVHLLAVCPTLATTAYLHHHNLIAAVIHWHLMRLYSFQLCSRSWYSHKPSPVIKSPTAKILWDFKLVTTLNDPSNHPDIVLYDFHQQEIFFVEIFCPADITVVTKEDEKIVPWQHISIRCIICQLPLSQFFWDVWVWSPLIAYSF